MIIPIIDLRILLEFPEQKIEPGQSVERKVAIIENGNKCIGLLFDRTGEVLNEPNSARVDFVAKQDGVKDVVIEGVLKLDGGKRMVQIVDPYEVLHIERVPQAEASAFNSDLSSDIGSRLSCVSFQIGHTWCAFDLRFVQEVCEMTPVESSLLAHGFVIGTTTLRGDVLPVVDFRSYMGEDAAFKFSPESLAKRNMLVIRTTGGLVGLLVYSIDSILSFFEHEVMPFAKLALPRGDMVSGCLISEDQQLVMLLNHERLLSDPSLCEPARLCQEVHIAEEEEDGGDVKPGVPAAAERRNFIVFTVDSRFAMDTCSISEVTDRPERLLKPPYALPFVEGIINLRGELITLVNLRKLYGLAPHNEAHEQVLIFTHDSNKFAILVDCVNEIVTTTSDKVSDDLATGLSHSKQVGRSDVSGALNISRDGEEGSLVLIMSVEALVSRFAEASDEKKAKDEAKVAQG
jgi:purine-binding chemotaxis protein CheW